MFTFNSISLQDDYTIVCLELHLTNTLSKSLIASINSACDSVEDTGAGTVLLVQLKHVSASCEASTETVDVHLVNHWERALRRLERLDATTISAIDGHCGGIGMAVLLTTDYRIAGSDVRLSLVCGAAGIMPAMALHRIADQIGGAAARQLVLLGMDMEVERASQLGIVDRIVDDTELAVGSFIKSLTTLHTGDLSVRRRLLNEASSLSYDDALGAHLAACDRFLRSARSRSQALAQADLHN